MSSAKKTGRIKLPNDFERMIPEYHKGTIIYGEHLVRYQAAQSFVEGKIVLDIASGSGYGTKLLAQKAKKVFGVDVSEDSVVYSRENFSANNIEYKVGDGIRIPLDDASVDVVVSFETIEHIEDYAKFMLEVKRVLKSDGALVLSTPNELEFADGNHFHLHEFGYEELKSLVSKHFKYTKSYFQGTWIYSALGDRDLMEKEQEIVLTTMQLAPLKPEQYLYFFLISSDQEITENTEPIGAISEHWSARKIQEKDTLTQQHINNLSDIADNLTRTTKEQQKVIKLKDDHINNIEGELARIQNSRAWRALKKLRR